MNKEKLIEISDMGLAAALIATGEKIYKVSMGKHHYFIFLFNETDEINEKIEKYYKDELFVSAKRLFQEYKVLKQIKFNKK